MSAINQFLLKNGLRIAENPCVSPDFCLDWPALSADVKAGKVTEYRKSRFATQAGEFTLVENAAGDCAWKLHGAASPLADGVAHAGATFFPASWANLLKLKNLIQEHDAASTIFPTGAARLGRSTLGVGARFTTLHWPAVEWAMSALEVGLTANQNSIPRELVYDVDAMLGHRLDTVPFPFIGTNVPEGHQGQSVEGMSHGCVLSKVKTGFHHRKIAWSFNADHQPIGGKFDVREDALVKGCLLASYITFDLSPELARNQPARLADLPAGVVTKVRDRVGAALDAARGRPPGTPLSEADFIKLLCSVWPSLQKMKRRDEKYAAARAAAFTTDVGRKYLRELSIDELPGLTTPGTTAIMLALCEVLGMPVNFVAPAFGFQKNTPYPDNAALQQLIEAQWSVCQQFGVSIGFHSGSGKSAENYRVMGQVTGSALEIKTSGRYTYEMGVAISQSKNPADAALWRDWYKFTVDMSVAGAFSTDATEQRLARIFITTSLENHAGAALDGARGRAQGAPRQDVFASPAACRAALEALPPSAEHMIFFEYNFLYVLAAGGKPEKSALGDHTPAGYRQRARFYAVSAETRLRFAQRIAAYLIFLAENTGLATKERCAATSKLLASYTTLDAMLGDISR
ncbi:tagaturonate epimerase family protein [Opitutus sp. GAS368]|uniref:tagaturonate epimerase family protein n=1 Tax=Opitutus sp. GAS368 TaxID=1882749 RepID=UPI00087C4F94|nr:tagaturonate epimerase family protein [Opitutus sp. GAS368]SDS06743.1 tagaturonate epimerase [Opitutus sp. GAS368]